MINETDPALTPPETSVYFREQWDISLTVNTLAFKRSVTGDGPEFFRVGRSIRYRKSALDAYARRIISPPLRSNTPARGLSCSSDGALNLGAAA
jgi:hypothetical protein